jgi:hypothetical protein
VNGDDDHEGGVGRERERERERELMMRGGCVYDDEDDEKKGCPR